MTTIAGRRGALAREGGRRLGLRAGMLLGSAVAGGALALASPYPVIPAVFVLGVIAVAAALVPDSPVVLVLLLTSAATWVILVPRPERPADLLPGLVAALGALTVHVCAAALAVWPPGTSVPRLARVRWWRRAGAVALVLVAATALTGQLLVAAPSGHRLLSLLAVTGVCAAALAGYRWSGPGAGGGGAAQ